MALRAGELSERISLYTRTRVNAVDSRDITDTYKLYATRWAAVRVFSVAEEQTSNPQGTYANGRVEIQVRYESAINTEMMAKWRDQVIAIKEVTPDPRRRYLTLHGVVTTGVTLG